MGQTSCIQCNDDAHLVLHEHAELDICDVNSVKQQSVGRHVAPLGHIIQNNSSTVAYFFKYVLVQNKLQKLVLDQIWILKNRHLENWFPEWPTSHKQMSSVYYCT